MRMISVVCAAGDWQHRGARASDGSRELPFVLAEGRFSWADGFRILDEGTIAVWDGSKVAADGILNSGSAGPRRGA